MQGVGHISCHITSTPEPVLIEIIKLLPFWTRRVVCPLVCKSWRRLCTAPELYEEILLDFPTECLPAIGIYPDHEDQPYVDIAAVGRWVARCLPRLAELRFECRHSRTYNNPSFDANVAMEITSQDCAALLGVMSAKLASLRVMACDDMVDGALLGALWCCSTLRVLSLHDLGYAIDVRRFNAGVRHLSKLEVLEVQCYASAHGWGLEAFPCMLCTLPALRALRLVNQRDIEALPEAMSQLTSLQELVLRDCGIQGLPACMSSLALTALTIEGVCILSAVSLEMGDWLGALSSLRQLSLKRSLLERCPPEAGALCALRVLDLSHCVLSMLPRELSGLASLEELSLASNEFPSCPEVLCTLGGLRRLDLYDNRLGLGPAIAKLPPHLTWLDLSRCRLASLPPALCRCTALVHLAVGGNRLEGLPNEFGGLRALEKLDLRKNCLREVPGSLAHLPYLRYLILDGNSLRLDSGGMQALLSLPRLWKLSARIKPPPAPPKKEPSPSGTDRGEGGSAGGLGGEPDEAMGGESTGHADLDGASRHGGAGATGPPLWRQLAEQLAAKHGRTVFKVDGLL